MTRPIVFPLRIVALAALLTATGVAAPATISATERTSAAVAGPNLVTNPGMEEGADFPACYSKSGWGTSNATWSLIQGRESARAVSLELSGHVDGDRKLLLTETAECAPAVQEGATYTAGVWYKSSVPVSLTLFRHTEAGWSYWGELAAAPQAADWTQATAVTPAIPAGTDRITFGLSIASDGTLTTDDYSLSTEATTDTSGNLIANAYLADGDTAPTCFVEGGWGERTVTSGLTNDVPADAPAGSRSYSITLDGWQSGDSKLLQSEEAGCAPAVVSGSQYDISVAYRSTATSNTLTAFTHTVEGWAYWTDIQAIPASDAWTTVTAALPAIPEGVDRVSFGIAIGGNGTLATTGYSMTDEAETSPPPPSDGTPEAIGTWSVNDTSMPLRAIHTTLLHDGRLLLVAGSGNSDELFAAGSFTASVWDPSTNVFIDVPVPYDMFCAGHVTLTDGKVLLAGGTEEYPGAGEGAYAGSKESYYFDPEDNQFHATNDMVGAHWYPSLTKLGDGDIWSAGGIDDARQGTVLTEMFDSATMSWLPQDQVPQTWSFWGLYPHMYLLDDGTMFYSGGHTFGNALPGTGSSLYDWRSAQIWDVPGLRDKDLRDQAGSVLLPPAQDQKVMIVGGGNTNTNTPAINTVDIIDLSAAAPAYVPGPDLPGPGKIYPNLVTLPDRTVLAANGSVYNRAEDVSTAAIYDPAANAWTSIESDPIGRNYHSTSILLPDGRVAIFGSNPADNSFEMRISIYNPPYLHRGERPTIAGAPGAASYGDSIALEVTGEIASASLLAPMSATHQTDTNSRLVDLPLAGTGAARTAQIPDNPNLLPPGPYLLTVLDTAGVPSVAKWIWIS